jgi:hypothetical protein
MQTHKVMLVLAVLVLALAPCAVAQQAPASFAGSLVRSATPPISTDAASRTIAPSTQVLIQNRARVYGDRVSADGTRYFYVSDSTLRGKTPEEVLQNLSPTAIASNDHLRDIESVVNLSHPLTLYAEPNQSINIGTAIVQGAGLKNVEAHSSVVTQGLTILPK